MKKLFTILFCLIGLASFGQTPLKTKQITADTARLKNLTVDPVLLTGYGTLFVKNDSLHFESPVKDWNLGKIVYQDSLGYYVMRSDSTTLFVTPLQLTDSLNILRDTTDNHAGRLVEIERDSAGYLRANGTRPLTGDWAAGAYKISNTDTIQAAVIEAKSAAPVIKYNDTSGNGQFVMRLDTSLLSHNYQLTGTLGGNTFYGKNSGNLHTQYSETFGNRSGSGLTGFGENTLSHVTTGFNNVAIGDGAGHDIRNASWGTYVGHQAGYRNISAQDQVAIGDQALQDFGGYGGTFTTDGNTALGTCAGYFQRDNGGNTFVGWWTGRGGLNPDIFALSNEASVHDQYCTFLGGLSTRDSTVSYLDTLQYATAIGYGAKVGLSNALVLGGTNAYAVNVGINMAKPRRRLDVAGAKFRGYDGYAPFYSEGAGFKATNYGVAIGGVEENGVNGGMFQGFASTTTAGNILAQYWGGNYGIGKIAIPLTKLHLYNYTADAGPGRYSIIDLLTLESENTADAPYAGFGQGIVFRAKSYQNSTTRILSRIASVATDGAAINTGPALTFSTVTTSATLSNPVERARVNRYGLMVGTIDGLGAFSVNGGAHIGGDSDAGDNNLLVDGQTKTATFQMTTGATNNYYLRSDASGNATWQPLSSTTLANGAWFNATDYAGATSNVWAHSKDNTYISALSVELSQLWFPQNAGLQNVMNMPVNHWSADNAAHGYQFKIGSQEFMRISGIWNTAADTLDDKRIDLFGTLMLNNDTLPLSSIKQFNSATLKNRLTDETGTGYSVFSGSPTFTGVPVMPTVKLTTDATPGYFWSCSSIDGSGEWVPFTGMVYKGQVDGDDGKPAGSGTPLIDGTGTAGWYYVCYDAGTYDYGNPSGNSITLAIGDGLYYSGTIWMKIPGAGTYVLPTMTATELGGSKLGNSLDIASEVLNIKNRDFGDIATTSDTVWTIKPMSSATFATKITDETGSGLAVFNTSPTLVTPILGTPQSGNFSTGSFTWPTFNQNTTGKAAGLYSTDDILIGNDYSTSDYMRFLHASRKTEFMHAGTKIAESSATGLNAMSGYAYQYNGAAFSLPFLTLGTTPATWDANDVNAATPKAIAAYVAANGGSGLTLGETSTTAYYGDKGKAAYDYSRIGHLPLIGGNMTGNVTFNDLYGVSFGSSGLTDSHILFDNITSNLIYKVNGYHYFSDISGNKQFETVPTGVNIPAGKTYQINGVGLAKGDVGLGNVANESKATMFTSPTFTGTPLAPTATPGTNTTQIATTAFVEASAHPTNSVITYTIKVQLTPAQLKALATTPIQLVPAYAAGIVNVTNVNAVLDYTSGADYWTNTGSVLKVYCANATSTDGLFVSNTVFYQSHNDCMVTLDHVPAETSSVGYSQYVQNKAIMIGTNTNFVPTTTGVYPINVYVTYTLTTL